MNKAGSFGKIICIMLAVVVLAICVGSVIYKNSKSSSPYTDDYVYNDFEEYDNEQYYEYTDVTDYDLTYDTQYNELRAEYIEALDNTEHDEDTYRKFIDAFDLMYRNYDYLYQLFRYRGMKTKEDYIREDMIWHLNNTIITISNQTWNGEPSTDSGQCTGDHIFVADDAGLRTVIHELSHCSDDMDTYDTSFYYIFSEGEASFKEQVCFNTCLINDPLYLDYYVNDCKDKTYYIRGIEHGDTRYLLYGKCYSILACLVDFDVLNQAKSEANQSYVEEYLNEEYGVDGKKLFNSLKAVAGFAFDDDSYNDGVIENLIEVEKLVNYCFDQSISKAKSTEELKEILDLRCYYNKQLATRELLNYVEGKDDPYEPPFFDVALKTDLDPYGVDNHLYEKCVDFGLLNLEDNETGKHIFDMLVGLNPNYYSVYSYNEARTISDSEICISSDGKYLTVFHNGIAYTQYELDTGFPYIDYSEIRKDYVDSDIFPLIKPEYK